MPSSSTRSTHLEQRLLHLFKLTWTRLHFAHNHRWAAFITTQFADLLDIRSATLVDTLRPTIDLSTTDEGRAKIFGERELFEKLKHQANARKISTCVWDAGDAVSEVGILLGQFGREGEGGEWGEWGRMLWEVSGNEALKEKEIEKREWEEEERKANSWRRTLESGNYL